MLAVVRLRWAKIMSSDCNVCVDPHELGVGQLISGSCNFNIRYIRIELSIGQRPDKSTKF